MTATTKKRTEDFSGLFLSPSLLSNPERSVEIACLAYLSWSS
jgi:hypothetical protein